MDPFFFLSFFYPVFINPSFYPNTEKLSAPVHTLPPISGELSHF